MVSDKRVLRIVWAGALVLGACSGDDGATTDTSDATTMATTATTGLTTSTTTSETSTTADSLSTTGTTDAVDPVCGNGVVENGEDCDDG
ncbi:MAG: hypothetical protein KC486_10230, partial [Myxococcales bacterium]|nr:hypothetical protein [Myxococcales bacterium]